MEIITAIIAAFKAIPVMSQDIRDIADFFRTAKQQNWFNKTSQDISQLNQPTTGEQKDALSKSISNDIQSM